MRDSAVPPDPICSHGVPAEEASTIDAPPVMLAGYVTQKQLVRGLWMGAVK